MRRGNPPWLPSKKALTLIELIFAMVILGLAVTAMMGALGTVSRNATFSEDTARLSFFTESLMEDVMAKKFDNNGTNCCINANYCTLALGRDANESASNSFNFNDIDDYNNCNDNSVTVPAPGFVRSVNVTYATLGANNTWQAANCGSLPCPGQKLITVTANRTGSTYKVTLTGMKSRCPGN